MGFGGSVSGQRLKLRFLCPWFLALAIILPAAATGPSRLFPLEAAQALARPWLAGQSDEALFSGTFQTRKSAEFREKHLGPWDPGSVAGRFEEEGDGVETQVLAKLGLAITEQSGFGPNLRPHGPDWLQGIQAQLPSAREPHRFRPCNRAVITQNALVRRLPTMDLFMRHPDLPGQGYAFDELQHSALWAGTPVYVMAETRDRAWCKVLAPDCAGWVPSPALARAGADFVRRWRGAVLRCGLVAVITTGTPVLDTRGRFQGHAYVGSVFPRRPGKGPRPAILVPARSAAGRATCLEAFLAEGAGVPQPWPYTPRNAARLFQTLLGRPYGWGNSRFHNDCSAELKQFFTPFGLWLPRHSAAQKEAGRQVDLSALALPERLAALAEVGRPYRSLLWFQGHVMLYLGPLGDPARPGFMTYQNLWGLRPKEGPDYRAVVGASVLFPLLHPDPDAPELRSLADRAQFVVTQLDEEP